MPKPFLTVQGRTVRKAPVGVSSTGNRQNGEAVLSARSTGQCSLPTFLRQESRPPAGAGPGNGRSRKAHVAHQLPPLPNPIETWRPAMSPSGSFAVQNRSQRFCPARGEGLKTESRASSLPQRSERLSRLKPLPQKNPLAFTAPPPTSSTAPPHAPHQYFPLPLHTTATSDAAAHRPAHAGHHPG